MPFKVIEENCIMCGSCIAVCPSNAITLKDNAAFIDKDRCMTCGACAGVCPMNTIKDELLLEDNKEQEAEPKKQLLHFYADWCGPCKAMEPILNEFKNNNPDLLITDINIDGEVELTDEYRIMSIPALVYLVDGVEVKRHIGSITEQELKDLVN